MKSVNTWNISWNSMFFTFAYIAIIAKYITINIKYKYTDPAILTQRLSKKV